MEDIQMKRKFKIVEVGNRWEGTDKYLIVPTWPDGTVDSPNIEQYHMYVWALNASRIYQKKEDAAHA